MGLIKAAMGAAGGVLADQWKEFFYCDSMSPDILMMKGQKDRSICRPRYGSSLITKPGSGSVGEHLFILSSPLKGLYRFRKAC